MKKTKKKKKKKKTNIKKNTKKKQNKTKKKKKTITSAMMSETSKRFHPSVSEVDLSIIEFGHVHWYRLGFQSKIKSKTANSADPDEMAHHKLSHLELPCLHSICFDM